MFRKLFCISSAFMLLLVGVPAIAQSLTPQSLQGAEVVTPETAAELHGSGAHFFDLRPSELYARGHVPGAVRMPFKEKSERTPDFDPSRDRFGLMKLPAERSASLVFYGEGVDTWPAYKAAAIAVMAGYQNVYWLREGFDAWSSRGLPVER